MLNDAKAVSGTATSPGGAIHPLAPADRDSLSSRVPLRSWFSLGLMTLLFALAYLDRQIISLMVAPIRAEFGVGDFQIGLLQGFAFALLYAFCALPLGQLVDRYPRRWIILGGVVAWSLAAMACGLAQTFNQLLFARIMVGAGEAALGPACYALLADLFPKRRLTFALAVFMVGGQIGAEGSLALGGAILHWAGAGVQVPVLGPMPAWRIAFLLTGLPGIPLAFLALLIAEPRAAAGRQNLAPSWRSVLDFMLGHKRFFAVQMLGFALVLGLAYVRLAWAPTFLMRTYGWSVAHVSYALASYGFVTGTLALLIGGRLVDFLYQRGLTDAHFRYYVAGGLILAVLGSASFLAPTPTWFFLLMLLPVFPLNMGAIGASAVQVVTPPELRGRVSAIYLLVIALIGMTLGPASVGLLTDRVLGRPGQIGIAMALVYGVCGLTVSALFLYGLPAMRRAAAAQSAGQEDPAPPR